MKGSKIIGRGLTKRFADGGVVAYQELSLEVYEHEILCVIGPSGCGKTTLLRTLDGLILPDAGEVLIDGTRVTGPRPDVVMVFQHFGLFPWKRLHENVAYGLQLRGRPREEVEATVQKYLKLVGLEGFERAFPYQLSGGMQQRAGLARALAVDPGILLMDEPFGAVDAQTREILQEELLRIWNTERKTMVFVTHSIDEAILLGDRILIMTPRPGRVKELLPVEIPRPRTIAEVRGDDRYIKLRNHLWDLLRREQRPGA
ncbi:MAG: ABC transporter ATP-binding protein [Deltaproteobacteria bacterium]|nr:ABC transporter ATP-binding protein [Deltaproteobacteria bacterium]